MAAGWEEDQLTYLKKMREKGVLRGDGAAQLPKKGEGGGNIQGGGGVQMSPARIPYNI